MTRLIDADKLKRNMEFICMGIMAGTESYNAPLAEIDNAPTVDITEYEEFAYNEGYSCGSREARTVYDRPKGEWLDEKYVAFHLTCNKCGCNIRRQKNEVFEGDYDYNFCPHCGADMRGEK